MKCKDCTNWGCLRRTSDAEKDCYYEQWTAKQFDWQSFRAEAAKDILCAIINRESSFTRNGEVVVSHKDFIEMAIEDADALIIKLKGDEEYPIPLCSATECIKENYKLYCEEKMIDFCNLQWTTAMEGGRIIHTGQPWMWYDGEAVYVENGTAELLAYFEPNVIHHWDGKTYHPTVACGLLRSVDTFGYGTFSAEIQLPKGRNLWPAFWLCGSGEPWPQCGEIDIVEAWTNRFGGYFKLGIPQPPYLVPSWNTTTNIHWSDHYQEFSNSYVHKSCGSRRLPLLFSLKRPAHNFVKYEVEWRQDIITFRVNGKAIRTYGYDVAKHLHDKRMNVIFDLWTTGEDFTCDTPMKIRNFEYKPIETL